MREVYQRLAEFLDTFPQRYPLSTESGIELRVLEHIFTPEEAEEMEVYHGQGCMNCGNTGYKGRVALYEVMLISDTVRELILQGASNAELKTAAVDGGMLTLRMSGLAKVKDGMTTLEEVVRVTFAD